MSGWVSIGWVGGWVGGWVVWVILIDYLQNLACLDAVEAGSAVKGGGGELERITRKGN